MFYYRSIEERLLREAFMGGCLQDFLGKESLTISWMRLLREELVRGGLQNYEEGQVTYTNIGNVKALTSLKNTPTANIS